MALLNDDQVEALLGRPLSESESRSFTPWLEVATERLNALLCYTLTAPLSASEALLLARLFATVADEAERAQKGAANYGISSKKVEDFSITFDSTDEDSAYAGFLKANGDMIRQLSKCRKIRLGKVRPLYDAYPL